MRAKARKQAAHVARVQRKHAKRRCTQAENHHTRYVRMERNAETVQTTRPRIKQAKRPAWRWLPSIVSRQKPPAAPKVERGHQKEIAA